ncbi:MAG TPA: type I-E CRISPR-associated protein Cas6/Cse3/CasE [Armatimonadota bacterium]|nr:type I-E CRISPR-associated protein Cas6/Cse3/CasE [Armatimonadota bacterium]
MYRSALLIDVGTNPDRPRPGRTWLRNAYRVHQRLCMAFPSNERRANDVAFLQPYAPEDFAPAQVHTTRSAEAGLLFRVDPLPNGRAAIIVQSAYAPDWNYAFQNVDFLAAPPVVKVYDPQPAIDQAWRFRLRANPTKRLTAGRPGERGDGARVQLFSDEAQRAWLARKAAASGFALVDCRVSSSERQVSRKSQSGPAMVHQAVTFDGLLRVTAPVAFRAALEAGIGSAKGFGFGLLSIARG